MKHLPNRSQYLDTKFIFNEMPEEGRGVEAPVSAEKAEVAVDSTPAVEAGAQHACGKGVCLGTDDFKHSPELATDVKGINTEVAEVRDIIEGGGGADVLSAGAGDDVLTEDAGEDILTNSELTPEVAKTLGDRGIDLETFEDRTIGGNSEAEMLSSYLEKNPEVDAKALNEATGNLFSQMTPEEQAEALAKMTPEEYETFLEAALVSLENPVDISENTYLDPETGEETTETNQFYIGRILEAAGIGGNRSSTSRASGTTYPGNFDVPSVSNAELLAAVETLAGQIGADPAALKAVVAVESGGDMGATRFEAHHAHKGQDEATSFGAFQIMGFNATSLGYTSATAMKNAFQTGGVTEQVRAFGEFLKTRNLVPHIAQGQQPDFRAFAKTYNGAGYAKLNYHGKMQAAYKQYKNVS